MENIGLNLSNEKDIRIEKFFDILEEILISSEESEIQTSSDDEVFLLLILYG
ncbi:MULTISPECIES: hypothetical protein [Clostridium]|uniref:Uncharacterized protein n=1 Tax=Clostridium intestinale DSM 6191 TaxID=1121320 RepID=A0A1M5ZR90_9CLOT|nr:MULTISPECIES: hypothetical protein [Clostridium]SHI26629.1 hypothetical protein SAMN02745941_03272 [Clostridium intestinale DSM 6191]